MPSKRLVGIDTTTARFSSPPPFQGTAIDLTRITPFERWDADSSLANVPHRLGARFGRFMTEVESFDAAAFRISPSEASVLDPQQRLMLQVPAAIVASRSPISSCFIIFCKPAQPAACRACA